MILHSAKLPFWIILLQGKKLDFLQYPMHNVLLCNWYWMKSSPLNRFNLQAFATKVGHGGRVRLEQIQVNIFYGGLCLDCEVARVNNPFAGRCSSVCAYGNLAQLAYQVYRTHVLITCLNFTNIYTVTLSIAQKVLLCASLQVPFCWLAEVQLPSIPGKK